MRLGNRSWTVVWLELFAPAPISASDGRSCCAVQEEFGAEGDPRQVANDMINTQVMPYAHYWLMGNRRYLHAARHYTIPA